ncbi:MAG: hypothetical protein PWQ55_194 [Chloroflexota bacterium]|nr:hypothetical protein [Chloroflexota bacterium]
MGSLPEENKKFIDEEIEVGYAKEPLLVKVPVCPDSFVWRGEEFKVKRLISQWSDLARRGNQAKNMRPAHLTRAEKLGSWGSGRFFFRVETTVGRVFALYYDRTPRRGDGGSGSWVLLYELQD